MLGSRTHRIRGGQVQPISDPKEPKRVMPKFEVPLPLSKRFIKSVEEFGGHVFVIFNYSH